ncbi:MAG: hypothetical protein J6B93_04280 [Clostridia bacterium]|nr:hypothetical protein [Clostridia bacterium]
MTMKKAIAFVVAVAILLVSIPLGVFTFAAVTPATGTIDAGNTDYVYLNRYDAQTDGTVGGLSNANQDYDGIAYDRPTVNSNIGVHSEKGNIDRWPFIAYKVNAATEGTYTITANVSVKADGITDTFVLYVDGIGHVMKYQKSWGAQNVSAQVYLPAGDHILIFTSPIPTAKVYVDNGLKDKIHNDLRSSAYCWMNYNTINIGDDLTFKAAPSYNEIKASVNQRLEAENDKSATTHYATYNGYKTANIEYSQIGASNHGYWGNQAKGAFIGGVVNGNVTATYADLQVAAARGYLDKNTVSYVEYKVTAPEDGKYNLRLGAFIGSSKSDTVLADVDLPFSVVITNGKTYKAQYDDGWKTYNDTHVVVDLKKGENLIRVTTHTAEQESKTLAGGWINQDFIDLDSRLTGVALATVPAATTVNGGDSAKVAHNLFNTVTSTSLKGASTGDIRWDQITLDRLNLGNLPRIPYVSVKVTAPADGFYDISANFGFDAARVSTAAIIVDRSVLKIKLAPNASIYLTKGSHVITFTSSMPATKNDVIYNGTAVDTTKSWSWIDVNTISVDGRLTLEAAPKMDEIIPTRIEAEDGDYAAYNNAGSAGTYKPENKNGASGNSFVGGCTFGNLKQTADQIKNGLDHNATPYVQYLLEAPAAGTYTLGVGYLTDSKNQGTDPVYITVMVNDKVYQAAHVGGWYDFGHVNIDVELKEGLNYVRTIAVTTEQACAQFEKSKGGWVYINYDYIDIPVNVTPVSTSQVVKVGDTDKVTLNQYSDKGDYIGGAEIGNSSWDRMTLDKITYDNLYRTAYAAIKVSAAEDGNYQMILQAGWLRATTTVDTIAVFIDGKAATVPFKVKNDAAIYANLQLTKGEHIIVFTVPMPESREELKNIAPNLYNAEKMTTAINNEDASRDAYPAIDYYNIILGRGLTALEAPDKADIILPFHNRVEAEDNDYAVYNLYNGAGENNTNASGGKVVGGVARWMTTQTLQDIEKNGLDMAHIGLIEYMVTAPADGEYSIRVGYMADSPKDKSVTKPFALVMVNDKTYKAQYTADYMTIQAIELKVELKEGRNYIRVTGTTAEQDFYKIEKTYINHDFIDLDKALTAEKRTAVVFEAEDSKFINRIQVQAGEKGEAASGDKVLGKDDRSGLSGKGFTFKSFTAEDLYYAPYFSVTVDVPEDNFYSMRLNYNANNVNTTGFLAMVVDGVVTPVYYGRVAKNVNQNTADISTYLTKGTHVLTFTTSIPMESTSEGYMWMNFDRVTFYDGITVAATQQNPRTASDPVIYEAEDYALPNRMKYRDENGYSGGKHIGGGSYNKNQTLAEIKKDGIVPERTPLTKFTINAAEAGTYEFSIFVGYAIYGSDATSAQANFVVSVNGKNQIFERTAAKSTSKSFLTVKADLKKGQNVIMCTVPAKSLDAGYVWANFDYIEIPSKYVGKLSMKPNGGIIEAERSEFAGYNIADNGSASGGRMLGSASYNVLDRYDMTFEKLDMDNLGEAAHVKYTVYAEAKGTYDITVLFHGGTDTYTQEEIDKLGNFAFAMRVNDGAKQKVSFAASANDNFLGRVISVDLEKGENTIIFTTLLAEYYDCYRSNGIKDETYRLYWIDHDALVLSAGLTGAETDNTNLFNIDASNVNQAQLTVKTPSASGDAVEPDTDADTNAGSSGMIWVIIGIAAAAVGAAAVIFFILLAKKKKKEQ